MTEAKRAHANESGRNSHAKKSGELSVSRVLFQHTLLVAAIHLGAESLLRSSSLPGSYRLAASGLRRVGGVGHAWIPIWPCSGGGLPCHACYQTRGALLPHHFTLTLVAGDSSKLKLVQLRAVSFLWHFPYARARLPLTALLPDGARTFLDTLARAAAAWTTRRSKCSGKLRRAEVAQSVRLHLLYLRISQQD